METNLSPYEEVAAGDSAKALTPKTQEWLSTHAKGTLISLVGMLILSIDPLLLRKLEDVDIFTVILYRGFFYIASLGIFLLLTKGTEFLKTFMLLGKIGLFASVIWGAAQVLITYALATAPVGSVLVINSSNPMFSALFSRILLGEVVKLRTIAAGLVCFASIVVIFFSEISAGDSSVAGSYVL